MDKYDTTLWKLLNNSSAAMPIPITNRVKMVEILLDVIIYIQSQRFCHLDLKPSNIMVNLSGDEWNGSDFVLADFGLSSATSNLTGHSGTPGFGAPEQFVGSPSAKSDNYSLGKTAVVIMFDWKTAWNLLAQPLNKQQYETHSIQNTLIENVISKLLKVKFYLIINDKSIYDNQS